MLKKLILTLSLISYSATHAIIMDFLKDVGTILNGLDEINRANRAALYQITQEFISKDHSNESSLEPNSSLENELSPLEKITTRRAKNNVKNDTFTFKDLAGEIPEDAREVVDFLKNAQYFAAVGAQMPKGVLLVGPPGTGKTSIARAIAGEAQANFFNTTGSEFIEVYVGVGPQRVRALFDKARASIKAGPYKKAVIFIDEIDAIGGSREDSIGGGSSEYRNTLNELLNQMDGFTQDGTILVIGATNTPHSLDAALKRPGRFDRIVEIRLPNATSREEILKLYSKKIACDKGINFQDLAQKTDHFSGADLKNLVNEAAVRAARQKQKKVKQEHFDAAAHDLIKRKMKERRHY